MDEIAILFHNKRRVRYCNEVNYILKSIIFCHIVYCMPIYAEFVLEFQSRLWFRPPNPARASVRGLEFGSGLLEVKHIGSPCPGRSLCPSRHHGRQQR